MEPVEEFEVSYSQFDIKPLILSSNMAHDMEAEESNEDIEVEFHAVMERIKPEENCNDSNPGFFSIPRTHDEPSLICRLCATRGNEMIDMLEGNEEYENIVEKIEECLPIVVGRNETLFKYACRSCLDKLDFFHKFYKAVKDADQRLCTPNQRIPTEVEMKEEGFRDNEGGTITTLVDNNGNNIETEADAIDAISSLDPNSEGILYRHVLNVHSQYKKYCCEVCGKQFRTRAELNADQRKHSDDRPFECEICSKRFYAKNILSRHRKLHANEKSYQCDQCGKRFDRTNSLTKHLSSHQAEAGNSANCQVCNVCKEVFADDRTADDHLENCPIGKKTKDRKIVALDLKEIYRCEYCQRCFAEIASVKSHRASHSDPTPYLCVVCGTRYSTYSRVTAHRMGHKKSSKLKTVKDSLPIPKYFTCEYCDKKYLHFTNMNVHRRSCLKNKNWTCGHCGDTFDNARELSKHTRGETGEKKLPCRDCDLCEKTCKNKSERDNRRMTHSGEKPYRCDVCGTYFRRNGDMRKHKRNKHGNGFET